MTVPATVFVKTMHDENKSPDRGERAGNPRLSENGMTARGREETVLPESGSIMAVVL